MGMSEEKINLKESVGDLIVTALADEVFTIDGTPMLTMKMNDGTFKNKPGIPGAEFMLANSYVGKRKQLIFIFTPVDAQPFSVEITADKVDEVFGTFGSLAGEKTGIASERTEFIVGALAKREKQVAEDRKAHVQKTEATRLEDHYRNNPLFGSF